MGTVAPPSLASLRCMIAVVGILVGLGAWQTVVRRASVDDALMEAVPGMWPDMRIDLNRATAAELAALPGLGAGFAERIIRDRAANGPFATIDDLRRVPGLGQATVDRLRPYATIDGT